MMEPIGIEPVRLPDKPDKRQGVVWGGRRRRSPHDNGGIDRPPPMVGEHTAEVLAEAGYSSIEIAGSAETEVIPSPCESAGPGQPLSRRAP
jgi:crotonobetainyl-CoA:carnitine CoA-transferase CaiB-like acyl-CoA transferase